MRSIVYISSMLLSWLEKKGTILERNFESNNEWEPKVIKISLCWPYRQDRSRAFILFLAIPAWLTYQCHLHLLHAGEIHFVLCSSALVRLTLFFYRNQNYRFNVTLKLAWQISLGFESIFDPWVIFLSGEYMTAVIIGTIPTGKHWILYILTSVCIFSVLFSLHFLRCW